MFVCFEEWMKWHSDRQKLTVLLSSPGTGGRGLRETVKMRNNYFWLFNMLKHQLPVATLRLVSHFLWVPPHQCENTCKFREYLMWSWTNVNVVWRIGVITSGRLIFSSVRRLAKQTKKVVTRFFISIVKYIQGEQITENKRMRAGLVSVHRLLIGCWDVG